MIDIASNMMGGGNNAMLLFICMGEEPEAARK